MIIRDLVVTPIAFRDPPLLNADGVHEPLALRTIVELVVDGGVVGLGEGQGGAARFYGLPTTSVYRGLEALLDDELGEGGGPGGAAAAAA